MNLPNRLTIFRIFLIPVIVLVYLFPYAQFNVSIPVFTIGFVNVSFINLIVLALFAIASFTDFLDGTIARKYNLITTFGKFADPIADKLLVNTMFILFASANVISVIPVLIMIARDTIVDGCRMIAANNGVVVAAKALGKAKTVSQMLTIILILLCNLPFELYHLPVAEFGVWFSAMVSFLSGLSYFVQLKEYIFESK